MEAVVAVGLAALLVVALHSLLQGIHRAEVRVRGGRQRGEHREAE